MIPDYEHVYGNLREAMRFFGSASAKGEVRDLDAGVAIASGIEYGVFNIAMLRPGIKDPVAAVDEFAEFFGSRVRRWSVWVCEDSLSARHLNGVKKTLGKLGMREITTAPGMLASGLAPARHRLPEIECVPVTTQTLRDTFGGLASVSFDVPYGVAREIYSPERGWNGSYRGWVGLDNGRPVGIVALVAMEDTLGVYSLAVPPEERRRGIGEAILREAIAQASAQQGFARIVLQSSESGLGLYRKLGFAEVAKFSVYLTK